MFVGNQLNLRQNFVKNAFFHMFDAI